MIAMMLAAVAAQEEWELEFPLGGNFSSHLGGQSIWMDDVNGDGIRDFAVQGESPGPFGQPHVIYVYSGAGGGLLYSSTPEWSLGVALLNNADVDGDGVQDLVASVPDYEVGGRIRGAVVCLSAINGREIWRYVDMASQNFHELGSVLERTSDYDGDGIKDLIVGDRFYNAGSGYGAALILSAIDGTLLGTIPGLTNNSEDFADDLASIEDLSGDGLNEFAIGAPFGGPRTEGAVYLMDYHGTVLKTLLGEMTLGQYGASVASGDINGDGIVDLCVNGFVTPSPGSTYVSRVYVYLGPDYHLWHILEGEIDEVSFASGLAVKGDVDGDGCEDILISAITAPESHPLDGPGRLYVYSGGSGALLKMFEGWQPGEYFGSSFDLGGDVDLDGRSDLLVSAGGHDLPGVPDAGLVLIYDSPRFVRLAVDQIYPGQDVGIRVEGCDAGASVGVMWSYEARITPLQNGFQMNLGRPLHPIASGAANVGGTFKRKVRAPVGAVAGRTVYLQALAQGPGGFYVSNPAARVIQ